jgi:hypothetical protein
MELDDLKLAWQSLDRRLELRNALDRELLRDRKRDKMKSGLRPLQVGQIGQILFGLAFIALAALLWSSKPDAVSVVTAGVIVQFYGIVCVAFAGVTLHRIGRIDYAAPVLDIQRELAEVRKVYVQSSLIAGLPWWFLWLPVLMVLFALLGVNLYTHAPSVIWSGIAVGGVGLLATFGLYRWSRDPRWPRLARFVEDSLTAASLRRAQAQLEELARFEHD